MGYRFRQLPAAHNRMHDVYDIHAQLVIMSACKDVFVWKVEQRKQSASPQHTAEPKCNIMLTASLCWQQRTSIILNIDFAKIMCARTLWKAGGIQ